MVANASEKTVYTDNFSSQSIMEIMTNFWLSKSIYTVVKLGIPDVLSGKVMHCAEISNELKLDEMCLFRLMRALASVGIFDEIEVSKYKLTNAGELLCQNSKNSVRPFVLMLGGINYQVWEYLDETVTTGKSGFELAFGMDVYDYLKINDNVSKIFNDAMEVILKNDSHSIIEAYDFQSYNTIVDVGGGSGVLLTNILNQNSTANGVLFDLPEVISNLKFETDIKYSNDIKNRLSLVSGDFFEDALPYAECYLLSRILHTFDDKRVNILLQKMYNEVPHGSKLIIMESIINPSNMNHTAASKFMDLNMMVFASNGRDRTLKEYTELLETFGFSVSQVFPTNSRISIIEAIKLNKCSR